MPDIEPPVRHENAAIAPRPVLIIGAILFAAVGFIAAVLYVLVEQRIMPQRSEVAAQPAVIPPAPRLQSHAPQDLTAFRSQKESLLESYAWIDAAHTTARIPIERGMALYVRRQGARASAPVASRRPSP